MENITSFLQKQWSLGARDWLKSLFYAILVPVLLQVQSVLESGSLKMNWELLIQVGLSAAVAHIIRKLAERDKVVTVEFINKDQVANAEYQVAKANKKKETPPPLGDPTHPTRFFSGDDGDDDGDGPGDPPPLGDPTHPPKK